MYLKSLKVSDKDGVIRDIKFHNGLNLIIDETPTENSQKTGNNVGKTTVLMLIDFCLGADAKNIYTDPEGAKEEYKVVKNFLRENNVLITMILKEDLSIENSKEISIERNFLVGSQMVRKINGMSMSSAAQFEETLTNLLFPGQYGKKPSLRQIISHNIRYKDLNVIHTLKTLNSYTSDDEYETLHLFMLGCEFDQGRTRQELLEKIKLEKKFRSRLEAEEDQTKSAYKTILAILKREIAVLDQQKSDFNLNPNFEKDLDKLNKVKYQINAIGADISQLNLRRELIREARRDLNSSVSDIDSGQLRSMYKQATDKINEIQKTFDDLLQFHNKMIAEKVKYITKDLPKLDRAIKSKEEALKRLLHEETILGRVLARSDSFAEMEELMAKLNQKHHKMGKLENKIQQFNNIDSKLDDLEERLAHIDKELFSNDFREVIERQVDKFNKYFADISERLYGEQYALKFDPKTTKHKQQVYKFRSFNTDLSTGSTGKKQGEIACFDIAYTLFADEENIPCLHIARLVNDNGIQFVAAILKDKLPEELNSEKYFVVKLSQADKLFKIESKKPKEQK